MRGLRRGAGLAAACMLGPTAASADVQPAIDLPATCAWNTADPAAPRALVCEQPGGGALTVSISGLTPDSVGQARSGDAVALRDVARFYMFGPVAQQDPSRAIALFEAAADKGDTRAMLTLATIYRDGDSVPRDSARSTAWYRKAAEAGSREGMRYLAGAYASGTGVAQDLAEALEWYRAAADKGEGDAMAAIGGMYFTGKGEPQDFVKAAEWFSKAAEAGSPEAVQDLAFVYDKGLGVKEDKVRAQALHAQFHQLYGMATMPAQHELEDAFPVEAAVAGVEGRAVYSCRLGEDRTLEDCFLRSEAPASLGFGAAGYALIPKMRLGPGLPVGVEFNLPIRFTLPTGIVGNTQHADQCAAEGLALRKTRKLSPDADWWARYWIALMRYDARQAGAADPAGPAEATVEAAAQRIERGKDAGLFGLIHRCSLN